MSNPLGVSIVDGVWRNETVRHCQCGTRLSIYNTGSTCHPCRRTHRPKLSQFRFSGAGNTECLRIDTVLPEARLSYLIDPYSRHVSYHALKKRK